MPMFSLMPAGDENWELLRVLASILATGAFLFLALAIVTHTEAAVLVTVIIALVLLTLQWI
jgi:hypothetical protein